MLYNALSNTISVRAYKPQMVPIIEVLTRLISQKSGFSRTWVLLEPYVWLID